MAEINELDLNTHENAMLVGINFKEDPKSARKSNSMFYELEPDEKGSIGTPKGKKRRGRS
jgi:hypothetical protein